MSYARVWACSQVRVGPTSGLSARNPRCRHMLGSWLLPSFAEGQSLWPVLAQTFAHVACVVWVRLRALECTCFINFKWLFLLLRAYLHIWKLHPKFPGGNFCHCLKIVVVLVDDPTSFSWQKLKDTLNYLVRSPIRVTSGTVMKNGKKWMFSGLAIFLPNLSLLPFFFFPVHSLFWLKESLSYIFPIWYK